MRRVLALICALAIAGCSIRRPVGLDYEQAREAVRPGDGVKYVKKRTGEIETMRVLRVEKDGLVGRSSIDGRHVVHQIGYDQMETLIVTPQGLRRFTLLEKIGMVAGLALAAALVLLILGASP